MTPFELTNQAVESVMNNNKEHHDKIMLFATDWVKTKFKSFTSENLKEDYYSKGNPIPSEPRIFGSVFRELSKNGLIFKNGFELSKNPKCHSRPQQLWISLEMSLKQKSNATPNRNQISIFT